MLKFADLLEANVDRLAKLESIAMGQPISVAKLMIKGPAALWRYYAGYAGKVSGETFPPDEDGTYKIVQYEPLGVCAGICAWNGTHVLAAWKMAPAMAAGNTFVLKTSEKSPIAACAYGDLLNQAGFPPGVINVLTGAGPVGSMLASHMDVAKIAFTGSAVAGRAVLQAAAKSNMKIVSLELGGKSYVSRLAFAGIMEFRTNRVLQASPRLRRRRTRQRYRTHLHELPPQFRPSLLCLVADSRPGGHRRQVRRRSQEVNGSRGEEDG